MSQPETISLEPIGYVETGLSQAGTSVARTELVSELVVYERYTECLDGIEGYSHLFVLFWMHKTPPGDFQAKVHPRGRQDLPLTGVLATRMRNHPNPIGLAVVELLRRKNNRLTVRRLDAYPGSPVMDIKPYDHYDVVTDISVPAWWTSLRNGVKGGE
jgi:tRNA-Thr(GGU) m(6)t(6)A37 methyltransferase TsaA